MQTVTVRQSTGNEIVVTSFIINYFFPIPFSIKIYSHRMAAQLVRPGKVFIFELFFIFEVVFIFEVIFNFKVVFIFEAVFISEVVLLF